MNLGAEPKKVAILGGVVLLGIGLYFWNSSDDSPSTPAPRRAPATAAATAATPVDSKSTAQARVRGGGTASASEFHPRLGSARPEDRVDPNTIDPALRLDLLAKVQAIEPVAAGRNLFQFGAAPAPDKPLPAVPKNVAQIPINNKPPVTQPVQPSISANNQPQTAPPVPLTLKYFGYKISKETGHIEAFLTDGDDIIRVEENQTLKQHYRVVKIAQKSITIEDTQSKLTQTLTLQENQA